MGPTDSPPNGGTIRNASHCRKIGHPKGERRSAEAGRRGGEPEGFDDGEGYPATWYLVPGTWYLFNQMMQKLSLMSTWPSSPVIKGQSSRSTGITLSDVLTARETGWMIGACACIVVVVGPEEGGGVSPSQKITETYRYPSLPRVAAVPTDVHLDEVMTDQ